MEDHPTYVSLIKRRRLSGFLLALALFPTGKNFAGNLVHNLLQFQRLAFGTKTV
jgi:hypothetical protein